MIQEADASTQGVLAGLREKSVQITRESQQIIIVFQFHDLMRQRLEHVATPLFALRDDLRSNLPELRSERALPRSDILTRYKTGYGAIGSAPAPGIVSCTKEEDDVTLF